MAGNTPRVVGESSQVLEGRACPEKRFHAESHYTIFCMWVQVQKLHDQRRARHARLPRGSGAHPPPLRRGPDRSAELPARASRHPAPPATTPPNPHPCREHTDPSPAQPVPSQRCTDRGLDDLHPEGKPREDWGEGPADWGRGPAKWGRAAAELGEPFSRWGKGLANWGRGSADWGRPRARWGQGIRKSGDAPEIRGKARRVRGNLRMIRGTRPSEALASSSGARNAAFRGPHPARPCVYTPGSGSASTTIPAASGAGTKARNSRTSRFASWRSATRARPTPQPQ